MALIRLFSTSILFSAVAWGVAAEDSTEFKKARTAIAAAFPDQGFDIWTSAKGDVNGDGTEDLALVLTGWKSGEEEDGLRGERLVVLTGKPDRSYTLMSISDEFCNFRNFYELDIKNRSLFVQGFSQASATGSSSITLQFRHNPSLNDLELIGKEELGRDHEKDSSYRVSVNYLTGKIVHSKRTKQMYPQEARTQMDKKALHRLQGFDCSRYFDSPEPRLYLP